MTTENETIQLLREIRDLLQLQAAALEPNYRYPLADYPTFDWAAIGATVAQNDRAGAAVVRFAGHLWTRRSGAGKFGRAIWFSRPNGRDDEGGATYLRLITFKDMADPEPLAFDAPAAPRQPAATVEPTAVPALAVGQKVKVRGERATKPGIVKHLATNGFASVQVGRQLLTVSTDRLVLN